MVLNQPDQLTQPDRQSTDQNLQIADLQNLLMIVDVASQRGAFKGPELGQVGTVFDRVAKFLQSVAPPAADTPQLTQPQAPQPTFINPSEQTPITTSSTPPFFTGGNS